VGRKFDLGEHAQHFAGELSDLLNNTICHGVRVTAVVGVKRDLIVLGYKTTKLDPVTSEGIPITLGHKPAHCYLGLSIRLQPDPEGEYLAVTSSFMGISATADLEQTLLHYDYERGKGNGYPEAHLQLDAASDEWSALCQRAGLGDRPLDKLHFPVGGRRYRPTLEDLIDFLITEGLAEPRPDWAEFVEAGREGFRRRQLKAAVRRDPDTAMEALRDSGHLPGSEPITSS
jgi:hypothetical protein